MSSSPKTKRTSGYSGNSRILYDAHGARVKSSPLSNKYLRALLFYVLPYLVVNGIVLLIVCATPHISINVRDTDNYLTTEVDFTVKSLLPIKELTVTLESEPVEYEKSGSTYKCSVSRNGTLIVEAKALNGMMRSAYSDISMLDDTAPSIDESTIHIEGDTLSFTVSDTQSGVNYDSIYGVINDSETIYPTAFDRETGSVSMDIPDHAESVELHFEDMVGNARSGRVSVTVTIEPPPGEADDGESAAEGSAS